MKISKIAVQNFLGLADLRHTLAAPLLFVAGPNGAGKSSLQDAVKFALTGEMSRGITKAGDRGSLITEGAAAGYVELVVDGYETRRNIGSGKVGGDELTLHPMVSLCLDSPRFAALPDADRRKLLFTLSGVKVDRETVSQQLVAAGVLQDKVELILPMLRGGFPDAADYAKGKASEARGTWKGITSDTYGSQKAATWKAPMPETVDSPEDIAATREAIRKQEEKVTEATLAVGRKQGSVPAEKRAEYEQQAGQEEALTTARDKAEKKWTAAKEKQQALEDAGKHVQGINFTCPSCDTRLAYAQGKVTIVAAAPEPTEEGAANTKLDAARKATLDAKAVYDDASQALAAARQAKAVLQALPPESEHDPKADDNLLEEKLRLQGLKDALRVQESSQQAAAVAEGKNKRAAEAHADVEQWVLAQDQLSPEGIPAVLLSKALDPINAALASEANDVGWQVPQITRDLTLTFAGRAYGLCSESEQWRADAIFAVVIANLSGAGILALDRFDALDLPGREEAIDWLANLAPSIGTVIVSGTLKSKPDLGADIDVIWLEKGAVA